MANSGELRAQDLVWWSKDKGRLEAYNTLGNRGELPAADLSKNTIPYRARLQAVIHDKHFADAAVRQHCKADDELSAEIGFLF